MVEVEALKHTIESLNSRIVAIRDSL